MNALTSQLHEYSKRTSNLSNEVPGYDELEAYIAYLAPTTKAGYARVTIKHYLHSKQYRKLSSASARRRAYGLY